MTELMQKIYGIDYDYVNKENRGRLNDKKYIIDAKWWRKWCDITGYGQIDSPAMFPQEKNDSINYGSQQLKAARSVIDLALS
jgi:hypothetical protein